MNLKDNISVATSLSQIESLNCMEPNLQYLAVDSVVGGEKCSVECSQPRAIAGMIKYTFLPRLLRNGGHQVILVALGPRMNWAVVHDGDAALVAEASILAI